MNIGFVGLGKMGALMVERLLSAGHTVVATDLSKEAVDTVSAKGSVGAYTIAELIQQLHMLTGQERQVIWIMVPEGAPVDAVLKELQPLLSPRDIVIDGGNSHYTDSVARAEHLAETDIHFMDVGTSGGLEGAVNGACLMIGGEQGDVIFVEPIFQALAQSQGYTHFGPVGAGHYVKMVHNGVEYAMVQAYGEGFELLKNAPYTYDLAAVARNWNTGSIVRSWVLGLAEKAFIEDPALERIDDEVGGGSTGEWTLQASMDSKTPIPSIYTALAQRYATRRNESFAAKVVAALRNQWGGHEVKKK